MSPKVLSSPTQLGQLHLVVILQRDFHVDDSRLTDHGQLVTPLGSHGGSSICQGVQPVHGSTVQHAAPNVELGDVK